MKSIGGIVIMVAASYFLGPAGANLAGWQLGLAVGACSVAYGLAINALFPPKSGVQQESEVSYSTATKGQAINVPFGTTFVQPNFIEIDESLLQEDEVKAGKGGGTVTGYEYYIPYSCYLCVGPIDRILRFNTSPGQEVVFDTPTGFTDEYVNLDLKHSGGAGGVVRVYQGTENQTRVDTGDLLFHLSRNYRNFCWMYLGVGERGYGIGGQSNCLSYEVLVERIPKCPGTLITCRGSRSSGHLHYNAANPAAVIFECLTNKIWGLCTPYEDIDIESFEQASYFYADENVGLNFTLENFQKLSDVLQFVQSHCDCTLLQKNGKITFTTLQQKSEDLSLCVEINEDNATIDFQTPTYDNLPSELIVDWTNPEFNYKNDTVSLTNPATWEIVGGGHAVRLSMAGFYAHEIVQQQARRTLRKLTNPRATAKATANISLNRVELGDLVRLVSSAWAPVGKKIVVPMRIVQITTSGSDAEHVEILMQEDVDYPRLELDVAGVVADDTIAITPWDTVPASTSTVGYISSVVTVAPLADVKIYEIPPVLGYLHGEADSDYIVALARKQTSAISTALYYSESGGDYKPLGNNNSLTHTGTFTTPMAYEFITRGLIDVAMDSPAGASAVASACGYCPTGTLIEEVLIHDDCYAIIDDEIVQIGYAELTDATHLRLTNVVRGCFGTQIVAHPSTSKLYYIGPSTVSAIKVNSVTTGVPIDFKVNPVSVGNVVVPTETVYTRTVTGATSRPLGPFKVVETMGEIHIYPRSIRLGAGMQDFALDCWAPPLTIDHSFMIVEDGGSSYPLIGEYVTPDPLVLDSGYFKTTKLGSLPYRIYSLREGLMSTDFISMA